MTPDKELNDLMQSLAQKYLRAINSMSGQQHQLFAIISQLIELSQYCQNFVTLIIKNPEQVIEMQKNYWHDAYALGQNIMASWLEGKGLPIHDSRFQSNDWISNPFFNVLAEHYLLATHHVNHLIEHMESDDKSTLKRLKFITKNYLDALSPANFLHTNPEIISETIESQGKNLLRGLHHLLSDLEASASHPMIAMTDKEAFILGKNIACTPGVVIYRNAMMELIQYTPQTEKVYAIPLLMIPPWINKYYILDLSPHNSLIRWLVAQGISVFVISWINPDAQYAKKGLFHYLDEGPKTALEIIKTQLQVTQVNTLGFCIGGTLMSLLMAYNQAHKDKTIHSATFLASMMDFSDPGDIAVFIDEQQIKKLEEKMNDMGYLEGKFMTSSFNSLRANDLIWSFFVKNYLKGKNPVPFDILFWNADATNMPAKMHSQYLRWMYLHNHLVKPGKIRLHGTPINIDHIDIPTFFVSTEKDHIAPWKTTYIGFELMKGQKHFILGGSGHISGIINPPSQEKYSYRINPSTNVNADEWYAHAKEHKGSWWPEWLKWLKSQSGKTIKAPLQAKLSYPPLSEAPGTYVLKSAANDIPNP